MGKRNRGVCVLVSGHATHKKLYYVEESGHVLTVMLILEIVCVSVWIDDFISSQSKIPNAHAKPNSSLSISSMQSKLDIHSTSFII